jgi:hypothetical protein
MKRILYYIASLTLLFSFYSSALAEDKSRPAIAEDFDGIYKLLKFPLSEQPDEKIHSFWPASCQFFGHYPDGYYLHQQVPLGECVNAIPASKPSLPQVVSWRFIKPGFFLIDRSDYKIQELWKVDYINKPTHLGKINLNEGDIIMQMLHKETLKILWVRLLRRVGDVNNT